MAEVYSALRQPLIEGNKTPAQVTEDICAAMEGKPTTLWWVGFLTAFAVLVIGVAAVT